MKVYLAQLCIAFKQYRVWAFLGSQDIKTRFSRTKIGPIWIFLNLSIWCLGVGAIYGRLFNQDMSTFLPFLVSGFVLWGFIVGTLVEGGSAFTNAEGYIKQFNLPKQVYLFRCLVSNGLVLFISILVYVGVALFYKVPITIGVLWVVPGLILLFIISFFHIVLMAYLNVYIKDTSNIVASVMQVMFFLTPVIFTAEMLKDRGLDMVYLLNPLYYLIELVRFPLLNSTHLPYEQYINAMIYAALVAVISTVLAGKLNAKVAHHL